MSASYWNTIGQNIAKGLGAKTIQRLSSGGKLMGRAGAAAGVGILVYDFYKTYKENIENEPAYKEMVILQEEMSKWTNAISCIGREPFTGRKFGSFDGGGAINALSVKKTYGSDGLIPADPQEAYTLIERAIEYILKTENLLEDALFETKKRDLVICLIRLQEAIYKTETYEEIQTRLSRMVDQIRPIESGYASRIYDCSQLINKTLGSNAAWAAVSMATLGFVKKRKP